MTNELTLKDKLRAAHVKRWHIVRTLREQNVAEHSFAVMLLATEIMKRSGNDPDQMGAIHGELGYELLRWAMWHDLLEVKTGDIATPAKKAVAEKCPDVFSELEESFSPEFKVIRSQTTASVKVVVKLADYIEALAFIDKEGYGEHASEVKEILNNQFIEYLKSLNFSYYNSYGIPAEDVAEELGIRTERRK